MITCLHSLQVGWPHFHLLYTSPLYLSNERSFYSCMGFLVLLSWFLSHWDALFLGPEEVVLEFWPTLLDAFCLKGLFPWDSSKKTPKGPEVSSPEIHGCIPAHCYLFCLYSCPATSLFNTALHHLMVITVKAAPSLHCFWVTGNRSSL